VLSAQQVAAEQPVVVETLKVETPQVTEQVTQATQPVKLADDTPVEIVVNGESKIVTAKEYKEILQRTDIWTQRMQAVAQQRKELENYAAQREAQILEAARAVQMARQELQQVPQNPQQQSQEPPRTLNPNEIATLGEVQQALAALQQRHQQELAQREQALRQELAASMQQAEQHAVVQQDRVKFTSAVKELMQTEDGRLLTEVNPVAEAWVRFQTLQLGPENVDQAIDFARKVFADGVGKVKGRFTQQQTQQAVAQAKVVMEPPAGAAPALQSAPQKIALKKDGSVDWDALRAKALAIMDQ
jgi:hypothetical protein